jgi:cytochrome c551/c552
MLAGYLGMADRFDKALVNFAVDYADQDTRDFEQWLKAIRTGSIAVVKPAPRPAKEKKKKAKAPATAKRKAKAKKKPKGSE